MLRQTILILALGSGSCAMRPAAAADWRSHPPMRALPRPSRRAMATGAAYFVDPVRGRDANDGTRQAPWRTINHGAAQLRPGQTLYLRGGVYYQTVRIAAAGRDGAPITVRSFPGELAVIDGGYSEFSQTPAEAWEPFADGAAGEYRSRKTYPELAEAADPRYPVVGSGAFSAAVRVLGNFGDSMVPLHGYHTPVDLRSDNPYWNLPHKLSTDKGIYCGPGLWYDPKTRRIHVRLAPTKLPCLGEANYRGQTDPGKLPLVVSGPRPVLELRQVRHLRLQDLVLRGTRSHTIHLAEAEDVALDNVVAYGGCPAMYVRGVTGLRVTRSALRGVSAPWSFRTSEKYRGISAYLFSAAAPPSRNVELAYSEFTDGHDGLILGTIDALRFHHNLVDSFNDDGIYLTTGGRAGRDIRIFQNRISRCLTSLSFAGTGRGQEGTPAYICRNVIDLRRPVHYYQPKGPDAPQEITTRGRLCADHGSPIWKPMRVYHNTILFHGEAFRGAYAAGLAGHTARTRRRVYNNIVVHVAGMPGVNLPPADHDFRADGNLHWGLSARPERKGDFLKALRATKGFRDSRTRHPPGWARGDLYADPRFLRLPEDPRRPIDLRLHRRSPAVDAGVEIPRDWPDPLRDADPGKPDIGAYPLGCPPWDTGRPPDAPAAGRAAGTTTPSAARSTWSPA